MIKGIGRYEILEELGRGAMAIVYKAFDPNIDRTLAIKVLREERCIDSEYRIRFLREAKAAGNLSHPNIVTIYDVGEYQSQPYIVMELLHGTPLDAVMKSGKKFELSEIVSIGMQLARALGYAHQNGVVHRDIKPSNIIYTPKGDGTRNIKITDFGIAHVEDTNLTQHTQIGEVLGTPQYMSPEQVLGQKVDGRSDLFSVGVILYQLLTNQRPFKGDTIATLLFQIATEDPAPIDHLAPQAPIALRRLVERLLDKKPEKRLQSGDELEKNLSRALHDVEDKALRKSEPRIFPLRLKWTLIMVVIVGLLMVTGVSIIYKQQKSVMVHQAFDYGISLVKFIATESAVPILSEDWVSIELFVKEVSERQEFSYLTILDHRGIIRGDSIQKNIGEKYLNPVNAQIMTGIDSTKVLDITLADRSKVFDFNTPILFQKKEIGRVHLGLSQHSLQQVTNFTMIMMLVLMVITIAVVAIITYVLGLYLSSPINYVKSSIEEVTNGNFNYRIGRERNDEIGQLFGAFDLMVESLQKRYVQKKSLAPRK